MNHRRIFSCPLRWVLGALALLTGLAVEGRAVTPQPYTVGVNFSVAVYGVGNFDMAYYGEPSDTSDGFNYDGNMSEQPLKTTWVRPGKIQPLRISFSGLSGYYISLNAPEGYATYVDGVPMDLISYVGGGGPATTHWYEVELRPVFDQSYAPFSEFSGIQLGKSVTWNVGLGALRNGRTAGRISYRAPDLANSPANRNRLYYSMLPNNDQLTLVEDGPSTSWLRQVLLAQGIVDVFDDGSGGHWMKFYDWHADPAPVWNGSLGRWTFSVGPWKTIHVESPGTSELRITETEGNKSRVSWVRLTSGSVASGTYTWTLKEGGGTAWSSADWERTTTYASTDSGSTRTAIMEVHTGDDTGSSTLVAKTRYLFKDYAWGEELVEQEAGYGRSDTVTTTFGYYTDSSARGNYRQLKFTKDTTGNWAGFQRYDDWNRRGQMQYAFKPWNSSPAAPASESSSFSTSDGLIEIRNYTTDWTGRYTRLSSVEQKVGTVTIGKTTFLQQDSTSGGVKRELTTASNYVNSTPGEALTVYSEVHRADGDPDKAGLPLVVATADQRRTVYAMDRGVFNHSARTFEVNASGQDWRMLTVRGSTSASGATSVSGFADQSFPAVNVITNKSTLEVTVLSNAGLLLRRENRVYNGSTFVLLDYEDITYHNNSGRIAARYPSNDADTAYTYADGLLTGATGADGVVTTFTHDKLWRVKTTKKAGAAASGSYAAQADITTTNNYDGAGRLLSQVVSNSNDSETITSSTAYDTAGRVTSRTPAGLGATTITYNPSARTVTTTAPDNGETIQTAQLDGRPASVTGSAAVSQYHTYGVESDGRTWAKTNTGTSSSPRWTKTWTDWLGRATESRQPGFSVSSQADFVTQHFYHATTGQLIKTTRTGYAPTLYEYNTLGQLKREGLDVTASPADTLTDGSMDRITEFDDRFEDISSVWWRKQTTTIYSRDNAATAFTASVIRNRLTGFSGSLRAESQATDAEGNVATTTTTISGKTVTTTTTTSGLANAATTVVYNGLPVGSTGYDGLSTLAQFDNLGRPWKSTDPRGLVTTTTYHAGTTLIQSITDSANKTVSTHGYDTSGRLVSQADALGATTYTEFNKRGLATRQWGSGTNAVEYEYDTTYGDRTKMRTWQDNPVDFTSATAFKSSEYGYPATTGSATSWAMDPATALVWKKTDAAGAFVEFDYNVRGQVATRKWARTLTNSSTKVTTTYRYYGDETGQAKTGELWKKEYNDAGEAIPTPAVTYTYDRVGQTTTVTDGTGQRTFNYNQSNHPWRLLNETLPAFYDSRVITRLNETTSGSGGNFGGHTLGTLAGRPIGYELGSSSDPDRDLRVSHSWSNQLRFVGVTTQAGGAAAQDFIYAYMSGSRLLDGYTAGNFNVSRGYETNRNLVGSLTSQWSTTTLTRFDYTHSDRYERLTAKQSGTAFADYYAGQSYSAVYNVYSYNLRSELETAAMYAGDTASTTPASGDELPGRRYEYRYDEIGNRKVAGATGNTDPNTTADDIYTVNALNQYTEKENNTIRLTGTAAAGSTVLIPGLTVGRKDRAWAADLVPGSTPSKGTNSLYAAPTGNPGGTISKTTGGWFAKPAVQTLGYDSDGNLTSDGLFTYTWNAENQLVRATSTLPDELGFTRQQLDFKYDYMGRRTEKRVTNLDTSAETLVRRFVYATGGWNLIAELTPAGEEWSIARSYTWGLDLTGDLTASGGVGALLRMTNNNGGSPGTSYYPTYDGNGNVVSLVNASNGNLAAIYEYDPFGNFLRNEVIDTAVADAPFRFSTKYYDSELGWSYYGLRYFSPTLGRFINRDPIEEQGGHNLYAFVRNNAINRWDYLGMVEEPDDYWDQRSGDQPRESRGSANSLMAGGVDFSGGWVGSSNYDLGGSTAAEWGAYAKDKRTIAAIDARLAAGRSVTVRDATGRTVTLTPGSSGVLSSNSSSHADIAFGASAAVTFNSPGGGTVTLRELEFIDEPALTKVAAYEPSYTGTGRISYETPYVEWPSSSPAGAIELDYETRLKLQAARQIGHAIDTTAKVVTIGYGVTAVAVGGYYMAAPAITFLAEGGSLAAPTMAATALTYEQAVTATGFLAQRGAVIAGAAIARGYYWLGTPTGQNTIQTTMQFVDSWVDGPPKPFTTAAEAAGFLANSSNQQEIKNSLEKNNLR